LDRLREIVTVQLDAADVRHKVLVSLTVRFQHERRISEELHIRLCGPNATNLFVREKRNLDRRKFFEKRERKKDTHLVIAADTLPLVLDRVHAVQKVARLHHLE